MAFITSANSTFMLTVAGIFPVPQAIVGYSTDAAFETEGSESIEVMKGVDGYMSYGYTPFMVRQTINLQADSPSAIIFETVLEQQKAALEVYPVAAVILAPSLGRKYTCTNGVLTNVVQISSARKVFQPRAFVITWDNISPTAM